MDKSFTASFFSANRASLLSSSKAELIVISANCLIQKSGDAAYPFKQDPNFWYLCGIDQPEVILVISKKEEYLIIPKLNKFRQVFDGSINLSALSNISGIDQLYSDQEGWQKLKSSLSRSSHIATLLPSPTIIKPHGLFAQPARRRLITKLKRLKYDLKFDDLRPVLARLRMVKQPVEIEAIKTAIDITTQTLNQVLDHSKLDRYKYSYQIEAAITEGFVSRGAMGHGFEPIIAGGKNATVIHYQRTDQGLQKGQLLVVDVGSEYSFYTADITRTISYGQPSPRQVAVFDAVAEVQKQAISLAKPGILVKEYEQQVEQLIGLQLIKLGLINKLDHREIRRYYPHSCSHSLGLDPHDSADYSLPLPKNMVMTVEPGIYIPEEAIGVRLEDDILLTTGGCEVLSSALKTNLTI